MIKRSAIAVAVTLVLAVSAFARTTPECRGLDTAEIRKQISTATEDPATTFRNEHRRAVSTPASVRCASKLWQESNGEGRLSRDTLPLKRAPHINPEKKRSGGSVMPLGNGNGNGNAYGHTKDHGKPDSVVIKKAGSSHADLRTLPAIKGDVMERPELEDPQLNPITLDDGDDSSRVTAQSVFVPQPNAQAPPTVADFAG